ncbi:hypothetical protein [Brachyspira hampsonii]|uniref:hypothetical protein n=1 Tax=Brachyspira hampsonii TaxID=1287055 RepID=UPI000D3BC021|nr:hypothetical protein [Brachyspira hampsonii]PTY40879.1 hypothetical protein DQ06_10115 [Brachyspira hampsonii bv. II]
MKRITIILSIIFIFAKISFAASGWQFGVMVPIGASFSFYNVSFNTSQATEDYIKNYRKSSGIVGFDAGVNLQVGYLITEGDKGISLLFDLGYAHDSFGLSSSYDENNVNVKVKEYYTFENLSIGILPKFHYDKFAFGLGIGVKLPLYLTHSMELTSGNTTTKTESYYDVNNIKNVMKNAVITYVKLTFDYSFYIHDEVAILLGAYVGTDFGIDLRGAELVMVDSRNLASLDFGVQLGLKFGDGLFD